MRVRYRVAVWDTHMRRSPNVDLMLARRRRRRASIKSTLGERLVFGGLYLTLPARESTLDVCRQILTSKVDPPTENKNISNGHRPIT